MKTMQIVYDSVHGKTKQVALKFPDASSITQIDKLWADVILFLCPTYGDEELPHNMETFLISLTDTKMYVICELGNYYGYEDFGFGAKKIIETVLNQKGWTKFHKGLSLDSFPTIDWNTFNKWRKSLEHALQNN